MLIIEITYKKSLSEVEKYLSTHNVFLEKHYAEGLFIASGAKIPREGGVIISHGDKNALIEIFKQDPFFQQEIADYRFIEFNPSKYNNIFKALITAK
jgi:uncharacterized protein YciI